MYTEDAFESEIYYDREPATVAVDRLHDLGYGRDDISVMMDDKTRERAFSSIVNVKGSEGIAAGATIGGVLGAIVAGLTATGSVVAIAGTGGLATPLVVGPLAAALAGLGAGAAGGGIVGGLIGVGIGESRARKYEKGLREGGILVAVRPKSKEHRADVRSALDYEGSTSRGEIDPDVEYAGERAPHNQRSVSGGRNSGRRLSMSSSSRAGLTVKKTKGDWDDANRSEGRVPLHSCVRRLDGTNARAGSAGCARHEAASAFGIFV
jgi:Heat induced stress protein YflT